MEILNEIDVSAHDISLGDYKYQPELTEQLNDLSGDFTQEIINEIVLWKVNRYCVIDEETQRLLNAVSKEDEVVDIVLTENLLRRLLSTKGIRLPMASTILRFKNPNIYQIIDQRAYRILTGENLKTYFPNIEEQITYYLEYLKELRKQCELKDIPFNKADQILYQLDKNKNHQLKIKT